jgi:hypothetical protein
MRRAVLAIVTVTVGLAACLAPAWRAIAPAPDRVYQYRAPITRYAPGDAGLWVVTARDASPDGRARLAGELADRDDVLGDGFVAWLDAAGVERLRAHPDAGGLVPLQPADRVAGPVAVAADEARIAVRVELAAATGPAQRDAIVAWLAGRDVRATVAGPHALDAELPARLARELATLGPVRWVERRGPP